MKENNIEKTKLNVPVKTAIHTDGKHTVSRRDFLKTAAVGSAAVIAAPALFDLAKPGVATAAPAASPEGGVVIDPKTYSGAMVDIETGAEALFKLFQYYGVDYIFQAPGTDWRGIWDSIAKSVSYGEKKPKHMQLLHEGHSVAMAIGYTAYTGRAQVVPFHVNVGQIHAAMELHGAYRGNVPMIIMDASCATFEGELKGGAQGPHYFNFQEYHMGNLTLPYMKWDYEVHTNLNLPQIVGRAFQMAYTNLRGPVHLFLPEEVMEETVTKVKIPDIKQQFSSPQEPIDAESLKAIAKLLVDATNPLIIAGGSFDVPLDPATVQLVMQLAELLGIPVVDTGAIVDFPTNHPLHLGFSSGPYLKDADVILSIENGTPWMPPGGPSETAKLIFMGTDPVKERWPYWGLKAEQGLVIRCDVESGLRSLITAILSTISWNWNKFSEIVARAEKWKAEHDKQKAAWMSALMAVKDKMPIDHRWLSYNVGKVIGEDTIIVPEVITHGGGVNMYIERPKPNTKFPTFGYGGLGMGLGVAQGIKLAAPDKQVAVLIGDGSFNFNPVTACLWASREYNLPILIVIYDNGSYESMGSAQLAGFPDGWGKKTNILPGAWLREYEYIKLADALGFYGTKIENPALVEFELTKAFDEVKRGRTAIVDARIAKVTIPPDFKPATY